MVFVIVSRRSLHTAVLYSIKTLVIVMDNHRVGTVLWSSGSNNWRKEMADQERRRVGRTTPSCPSHELQWLSKSSEAMVEIPPR
jgi:hypothetical protein